MKRILIVDDNELNITILLNTLGNTYDVSVALSAKEAFEVLDDELPDLIVLDIMMEEMSGIEMCKKIKSEKRTEHIPVIFLTAAHDALKESAYEAGADDFMGKPFEGACIAFKNKKIAKRLNMLKSIPNILIIDDNPSNIDFLLGLLTEYDISAAVDGEGALDQIAQEIPDLILLDVSMPGMDGHEVCSIIKSSPKTKHIPVLFLSANTDSESVVKGFEAGGVDYITKPYRPREVLARVETHLKLKQLRDELEKMAYEDPMTGIANRRRFFEKANTLFSKAKLECLPLYLFALDIDRFKEINDTYGHDVGDEVLKLFVDIVKKELGKNDCFSRFGGDEFVIMAMQTSQEKALNLIKKIQDNISKTHMLLGVSVDFSVSIGMTEVEGFDEDIDAVIKRADVRLYREKRSKRNSSRD